MKIKIEKCENCGEEMEIGQMKKEEYIFLFWHCQGTCCDDTCTRNGEVESCDPLTYKRGNK